MFYINRYDSYGNAETVSETDDEENARYERDEYKLSDPSGEYVISRKPLEGWEDD